MDINKIPKNLSLSEAMSLNKYGSLEVSRNGHKYIVPKMQVDEVMEEIRNWNRDRKRKVKKSATMYVMKHEADVLSGKAPRDVSINVMQDIAILEAIKLLGEDVSK